MKEKVRAEKEIKPGSGGGDSIFDVAPEPESKDVSVSSGPYIETLPVAGMTVGEVRRKFADRFDIDKESTPIINGKDTDEDYTIKAGEALMFVRHAGEKGGPQSVVIEDSYATAASPEGQSHKMKVGTLIGRAGADRISTGDCILPTGVKSVLSRGPITVWVWEKAPCIQKFQWIRADSPRHYGPGTTYRPVRIALPYLVIFAVFQTLDDGLPRITQNDECFFRNEPLKSLDDELHFPALLNCSKFPQETDRNPLSWICTQHLKANEQMKSPKPSDRFAGGFEAVRYCLLETAFNLSSEHHEGNSWYGASKGIDKRIGTIEEWEKATTKDPLFALGVPWVKTHHSVKDVAERIFKRCGAADTSVKNSSDLARIIFNA